MRFFMGRETKVQVVISVEQHRSSFIHHDTIYVRDTILADGRCLGFRDKEVQGTCLGMRDKEVTGYMSRNA